MKAARVAAERSAVLLRNENALLPLDLHALKSIAVIGPLADSTRDPLGPWVFPQNDPPSSGVLTGLRANAGKYIRIDYAEGVRMPARLYLSPISMMEPQVKKPPFDESVEFQRAVDLARGADVTVLVLGEAQDMSGEIASRSSLDLPGRQQELLDAVVATGKPVVVLLKGFQRVTLRSGETRHVSFTLTPDDLRYWTAVSRSWVQDDSQFDVWVGGSSAADLGSHFQVSH
jgi:beta-glucosidase